MLLRYIFMLVLVVVVVPGFAQPLPECYHRLDQVHDFIFELEAFDTNNRVHIDSIGHSNGDMLGHQYPIYAVKISDTADVFQNEPVMLVICHIHAEEVIGLELCLDYMWRLVHQYGLYSGLVNSTQIYFIPTMNPDGLQVISYGVPMGDTTLWDNTWRKNGYIPPQTDCNVQPGSGGELCGVDLNRNFELNWIFGDTLWREASLERYDYYRGPSPFSEPEARAVRDFALQIKPSLSIVYHSSRQGVIAENGIVAWQWGTDPGPYKWAPDCTAIGNINRVYCGFENGLDYSTVFGGTHNGCLQDWFYWRLGCIQILTELGPPVNIQPPCPTLEDLIDADRASLNWLHRRLINNGQDMGSQPAVLRIYTRDTSDTPISAEWRILNTQPVPSLAPWYTNEQFGRATFHPPLGWITIMARKEGYIADTASTSINPSGQQDLYLYLEPLSWHNLTINVRNAAGEGISGRVYLDCDFPKWLAVPAGGRVESLPEGEYRAMIVPDDGALMVMWRDFDLGGDATLDVWCPASELNWSENFENGLTGWTSDGSDEDHWHLAADTTTYMYGQSLYTNPTTGSLWPYVYPNDANTWMQYQTINVPSGNISYLQFDRRGRLEAPADSFLVEVSVDGQNWHQAAGFSDLDVPWTRTYVDLSEWTPVYFNLRFRLVSDHAVGELGMYVDNLKVYSGLDSSTPEPPTQLPRSYRIVDAYPNPFNPATTIRYQTAGSGTAEWAIFNISGQLVRTEQVAIAIEGDYKYLWNGADTHGVSVPTGLYFVQMRMNGHVSTHKVLLLR